MPLKKKKTIGHQENNNNKAINMHQATPNKYKQINCKG